VFFFEKKNQKTFALLSPAGPRQKRKSLLLLFFGREGLSALESMISAAERHHD
jgi:hypothetical protein